LVVNFGRSVNIVLWRPEVARPVNLFRNFCVFLTTPYDIIFQNSVPKVYTATTIDVIVFTPCSKPGWSSFTTGNNNNNNKINNKLPIHIARAQTQDPSTLRSVGLGG